MSMQSAAQAKPSSTRIYKKCCDHCPAPFFLLCLVKGVFSPVLPDHGYFAPSLSFAIIMFTSFYHVNLFGLTG